MGEQGGRSERRSQRCNAMEPINRNDSGSSTFSGRGRPNSDAPRPGKLFVGNLSWETSSEKLWEYFGTFGIVTDVSILKDLNTQRSRGCGFVTFANSNTIDRVLKIPIHILDGRRIDPKYPIKSKNRAKLAVKKIFVGGISQDVSSNEIKAYFNQFGEIDELTMPTNYTTWRHRGFGFITFRNENVANRVCELRFHKIKNKNVECEKLRPKEVRQPSALNAQSMRLAPQPPQPPQPPLSIATAAATTAVQMQSAVMGDRDLFAASYPGLPTYRYYSY